MANKEPMSPSFSAMFLGSMSMHKLYAHKMQPWVMLEVRRKKEKFQEVSIIVDKGSLRVCKVNGKQDDSVFDGTETTILLEHDLQRLSRFAKLHQDKMCFGYLTHHDLNSDYECHVFQATTEEIVS